MNEYSLEQGMLIIFQNMAKGIALMLLLFMESGVLRQLMYFLLIVYIGKGVYDLYKISTLPLQFIAFLYMAFSGVVTGFAVGFILMALYTGLAIEFRTSLLRLILISLPLLSLGLYLAYRLERSRKA